MAKSDYHLSASAAIIEHIEHLSSLTVDAVNNRDFSPSSPGWNYKAPNFTCNVLYDVNNIYGNPGADAEDIIDLNEHIARVKRITSEYPEWRLKLVSQSTHVHDDLEKAEVFQVCEVMGHPPGIVTRQALSWDFQFWEGRWWCTKKRMVRGMGME